MVQQQSGTTVWKFGYNMWCVLMEECKREQWPDYWGRSDTKLCFSEVWQPIPRSRIRWSAQILELWIQLTMQSCFLLLRAPWQSAVTVSDIFWRSDVSLWTMWWKSDGCLPLESRLRLRPIHFSFWLKDIQVFSTVCSQAHTCPTAREHWHVLM